MKVDVLNGVNLDVLERRDPAIYGGLSLHELEQRIEAWADELGHTVRCRQTNNEGEYVKFCHDSLDWADGVIANPGAWSHYSYAIHDALEIFSGPLVEVHLSNPEEREEEWRHTSVISGPRRPPDPRPRAGRLPRRPRLARGALVNARVDRLREKLEQPLLVSDPANVRYLSGLASSNAALLVDAGTRPGLHRLPIRRERAGGRGSRVRRGEARPLPDAVGAALGPDRLRGHLAQLRALLAAPRGRGRAGPDVRARRGAPGRQGRGRARVDPARRRHREHRVRALRRRGRARRPDREGARLALRDVPARGERRRCLVSGPRRVGPERGQAAHGAGRAAGRARGDRDRRRGLHGRRLLLRLHADLRHGLASRRAPARLRGLPRRAARGARGRQARCVGPRRRLGRARPDRGGRLRRGLRARARPRRRACSCTRIPASRRSREARSPSATSSRSSPGSTSPASAGSGSRTSSSSARTGRRS